MNERAIGGTILEWITKVLIRRVLSVVIMVNFRSLLESRRETTK